MDTQKVMPPHSSTLAWKILWTQEPGRLQFMGSQRVRHDWVTSLSLFTFMHWRRKWQPTPVFLPGESQAQGSLVGCSLWGRTESDTTEATQQQQQVWIEIDLGTANIKVFSYCLWGSQGKNTEVVCHFLLQWITFCQISPPWPTHLGLPHGHDLVSLS